MLLFTSNIFLNTSVEYLSTLHVVKKYSPRTLDVDGNGYLDFKEFIMANDLVAAKTPEQKLSWAFKV